MTTPPSAPGSTLEALPNPRGGAVRAAETALADALSAHEQHRDAALSVLHAAHALREAGWLAAHRFADALVLASPLAFDTADAARPAHLAGAAATESPVRTEFGAALRAFAAALGRRNLQELSCSPSLYVHYRALSALIAQHTPGFTVAFENLALAGRPVSPAMLHTQPAQRLAHLRARYEQALLPVLRAQTGDGVMSAATLVVKAALDELEACIAELTGPDPYDFWRLAGGCARALRVSGHLAGDRAGDADARRFFARCNLALADQARGIPFAPRSLVRATLALLWRDYALFGAAAEDTDPVELLRDYGLTVVWHVAGTSASEALWEAQAAGAGAHPSASETQDHPRFSPTDPSATPSDAHQTHPSSTQPAPTRALGAVTVHANAYEDFLQTADASIAALSEHARAADNPQKADPSAALQAGDAAYRLGASACALGLGHVALLSDALGLAWRRRAHAAAVKPDARTLVNIEAPDAATLEHAALALRAMLHQIAAGIAPPQSGSALAALTRAIELGGTAT
ncbi:hypothetical protein [Paraburkholderia humisilvae]|uniref:Scaffold protein FimL second domain-containing protein n=1 Tax=Paraburkholderia humisilvae TaxID=627669 RepID=A0A6J5E4P2_9BURK|nr:hypothetical protein [Paraburkholderia humisilvae]CAB3760075.1 hypothetical protein LMG29542_03744 [Paraburkholderia humisilvae]